MNINRPYKLPLHSDKSSTLFFDLDNVDQRPDYDTENDDDNIIQQKMRNVLDTVNLFRPVYRTTLFCVYESPTQLVKIGNDPSIDLGCFYNKQAKPWLSNVSFLYRNNKFIPNQFRPIDTLSPERTMLVFNRRPHECRLCDIDTLNWSIDTRIQCFKLIAQTVQELNNNGIFFLQKVNPGLVSLYQTDDNETRACCHESEVLRTDSSQPGAKSDFSLILSFLRLCDSQNTQHCDVVPDLFAPSIEKIFIDYTEKQNGSDARVLSMPDFNSILAYPLFKNQSSTHCISDCEKIHVRPYLNAIGLLSNHTLTQKLMTSKLPLCYFTTESNETVSDAKNAFTNFTSPDFKNNFVYNKPPVTMAVFHQRYDNSLLCLPEFLEQNPDTSDEDLNAILRKSCVLWYKLARCGIMMGPNASTNNIHVQKTDNLSIQLEKTEYMTISDATSRMVRLEMDCQCNYDVFIDLTDQRLLRCHETRMVNKKDHATLTVSALQFTGFLAQLCLSLQLDIGALPTILNEFNQFCSKYTIRSSIVPWFNDQHRLINNNQMVDLFQTMINIYVWLCAPHEIPNLTIVEARHVKQKIIIIGLD